MGEKHVDPNETMEKKGYLEPQSQGPAELMTQKVTFDMPSRTSQAFVHT